MKLKDFPIGVVIYRENHPDIRWRLTAKLEDKVIWTGIGSQKQEKSVCYFDQFAHDWDVDSWPLDESFFVAHILDKYEER